MGLAVYVHIPFCDYKCTFCDFATYVGQNVLTPRYVDALISEIKMRAPTVAHLTTSTVFFGGGTPTLLAPHTIARILEAINLVAPIEANAEITAESNPDTLDPMRLEGFRAAGINRLSIGVQTLNAQILHDVHRGHSPQQAIESLRNARAVGFSSISADLMFGLPNQTAEDWEDTLQRVLACEPDHLSLYGLIVEDDTLLRHQLQTGAVGLPEDDAAADMYEYARSMLDRVGYVHYEISNWGRPGHASRHNLVYWQHLPYLGVGLSAHSLMGNVRSSNVRGLRHYLKRLEKNESPTLREEYISAGRARADAIMVGLRLIKGIEVAHFDSQFGGSLLDDHRETIETLIAQGLMAMEAGHLRLTERAQLIANQVWLQFI